MKATKIEFNSAGFQEVLFSPGVHDLVQSKTEEIKSNADANNHRGGEGFATDVIRGGYGGGRWIGFVRTTDRNSVIAETEDKALSGAVK